MLFRTIAESSIASHENREAEGLALANMAEKLLLDSGLKTDLLGSIFYQHVGDVLFASKSYPDAIAAYRRSSSLEVEDDDFVIAWNHYKVGLVSSETDETQDSLLIASQRFVQIGNYGHAARALGALAAHFLVLKDFQKAIELASKLANWYHHEKRVDVGPALRFLLAQFIRSTLDLSGKPLNAPIENFPIPDRKPFLDLPKTLRPEAGAVSSYQVISQLAHAAGLKKIEIETLKKGIYSDVERDVDRGALSVQWFQLFQNADISDVNEHEITLMLKKLCQYQPAPGADSEKFFIQSIFRPFEDRAKVEPEKWGPILLMLVSVANQVTSSLSPSLAVRWDLYLDFAEGTAHHLAGNEPKAYTLLARAADRAMSEKNWGVAEEAAFLTSFALWEQNPSLLKAAEANYHLFISRQKIGLTAQFCETLGINMYRFWGAMTWRRLAATDLKVKEFLHDSAKELKKDGFDEKSAAPIMVALLLKAFDHDLPQKGMLDFVRTPPSGISALLNI